MRGGALVSSGALVETWANAEADAGNAAASGAKPSGRPVTPASLHASTNGSTISERNCAPAWKVAVDAPVAISPESWVSAVPRLPGVRLKSGRKAGDELPAAKPASIALATARWLPDAPGD